MGHRENSTIPRATWSSALEKQYQPKLTDGIKVEIELPNNAEQDKEDGDIDFKITIAPNNFEDEDENNNVNEENSGNEKVMIKSANNPTDEEIELLENALRKKYGGENFVGTDDYKAAITDLTIKAKDKKAFGDRSIRSIIKKMKKQRKIFDTVYESLYTFNSKYEKTNYYKECYMFLRGTELSKEASRVARWYEQIITHAKSIGISMLPDDKLENKAELILRDVFLKQSDYELYRNGDATGINAFYAFEESYLADLGASKNSKTPQQLAVIYDGINTELSLGIAPLVTGSGQKITSNDIENYRRNIRTKILSMYQNSTMTEFNEKVLKKSSIVSDTKRFPSQLLSSFFGGIFEKWLNLAGLTKRAYSEKPTFKASDKLKLSKKIRQADGYIGITLLDAKLNIKGKVGRSMGKEDIAQMEDYAKILASNEIWKSGDGKPIKFLSIRYQFNDAETAELWFGKGADGRKADGEKAKGAEILGNFWDEPIIGRPPTPEEEQK